jgi:hypothetical protein
MKVIASILFALSCARPVNFVRVDGQTVNPAAKAICNGAAATSFRPAQGPAYAPSFNVVNSNIYGSSGSYCAIGRHRRTDGGQMAEIGNTIADPTIRNSFSALLLRASSGRNLLRCALSGNIAQLDAVFL